MNNQKPKMMRITTLNQKAEAQAKPNHEATNTTNDFKRRKKQLPREFKLFNRNNKQTTRKITRLPREKKKEISGMRRNG